MANSSSRPINHPSIVWNSNSGKIKMQGPGSDINGIAGPGIIECRSLATGKVLMYCKVPKGSLAFYARRTVSAVCAETQSLVSKSVRFCIGYTGENGTRFIRALDASSGTVVSFNEAGPSG